MAETPRTSLSFDGQCPDCGQRKIVLPADLPQVGDDFDWDVRDYDGFRLSMMEELAARFPERKRWTPADVEVALVEVFAAGLDQLSDQLDRVSSEAYLETSRRPESVRRLLKLVGFDALEEAKALSKPPFDKPKSPEDQRSDLQRFEQYWLDNPLAMQEAKQQGPRQVHQQKRMVTVADYQNQLAKHPLVLRASSWQEWGGSWPVVNVAVIGYERARLDEALNAVPETVEKAVDNFHAQYQLKEAKLDQQPTLRTVLRRYVEAYRMLGQEVVLHDAVEVGIEMDISIHVSAHYFQSEVRHAVEQALGTGPSGFFAANRLKFGEDLFAGDIFQTLMALDGVGNVCLNRFKRIGNRYPNQAGNGQIRLDGLEIGVCDNTPGEASRGYYSLRLTGGRKG